MLPDNCIYKGEVYHARHTPFIHDYKYKVFGFFIDIDDLPELDKTLKYFSLNTWNITSLNYKDHGRRDGTNIRPWIEKAGREKNIDLSTARIYMLAFPRLWGYVFNPITIYYCYTPQGDLIAMLYQVKNTFGEQHGYLLPFDKSSQNIKQKTQKVFHVSPFIHMDCEYHFRLKPPDETLNFAIHQFRRGEKMLTATWTGQKKPLSDKQILKTALTMPLMTLKVITSIHWQALRLWLKGAKYIRRPPKPSKDVS